MSDKPSSYIRQMCDRLAKIEQETLASLGEEKG